MIANVFDLNIEIEQTHTEIINKSLKSVYKNEFNIPELQDQIKELKYFNIL
jgi:hypothetical protein